MIMPKKPVLSKTDRTDPKKNKSLAIRLVLQKKPNAKASEVATVVKKEYGHTINPNQIYMIKTKANMASDGRPRKTKASKSDTPLTSAALWVDAIKTARLLLKATGSVPNAIAILKAIDS
jgi:hypothetical protein